MKMFLIIFFLLTGLFANAQSIFEPLPHPVAISKPTYGKDKAIVIGDSTLPTPSGDSTLQGFRLTGLSVLYGITNGYTASNVYAGTGIGYEWDSYSSTTGRWNTSFAIGLGIYEGGHIAPANLQAATAVGLNVYLFNKFLNIGVLYNLNSPAGTNSHWVGAIGGNAAFVPTN
jgi:hypothetical protein